MRVQIRALIPYFRNRGSTSRRRRLGHSFLGSASLQFSNIAEH
jgi:hypothetical protein